MTLTELIEKLAAAEGPSRELDAEIYLACLAKIPEGADVYSDKPGCLGWSVPRDQTLRRSSFDTPRFTSSIDAALSLVPPGLPWMVRQSQPWDSEHPFFHAYVQRKEYDQHDGLVKPPATPALALCIAALRARALAARQEGE